MRSRRGIGGGGSREVLYIDWAGVGVKTNKALFHSLLSLGEL